MSTRARIGIVRAYDANEDPAEVESIYHHWDGYPSWLGVALLEHWTEPAKVEALIALGDLSLIGEEIGEQHDFDEHGARRDWCLAYSNQDYEYLYGNDEWSYREVGLYSGGSGAWAVLDRRVVAA